MPPETAALATPTSPLQMLSHASAIAPEIILTAWGLMVLIVDISILRRRPSEQRRSWLGRLTIAGAVAAMVGALWAVRVERVEEIRVGPRDSLSAGATLGAGVAAGPTAEAATPGPPPGFRVQFGSAPSSIFSGTLSDDVSTTWMNLILAGMLALVAALSMTWDFTEHWGEYFALLAWATVGMMFLVAAEELLTLFLSLEMMTICLYLMTSLEKQRRRSAEGGLKYFVYGSVSSALFLFGLSLIYGMTGTTRLGAMRLSLLDGPMGQGLTGNVAGATAVLLVLVGFGFKVAAVPFHQWAPDTYEGAPAPVAAWIGSGSKIASFVALMKVLLFGLGPWATDPGRITTPGWVGLLALIAAVSMTYGNFAALAQRNFKRMLAYSSVAHAGYILVGVLAVAVSQRRGEAAGGVLYYVVTYGFATVGAFAVAAWLAKDLGTDEIEDLNGLGARSPAMAVCVVILMLSLIGMPPLAGFFGKLFMFMDAMNTGEEGRISLTWLVALGLFNSVVSAFYYVRVLKAMFLRRPSGAAGVSVPSGVFWSIAVSTAVTLSFGLRPDLLLMPMQASASQMIPTSGDVRASRFATGVAPDAAEKAEELVRRQQEASKKYGLSSSGGPGGGGRLGRGSRGPAGGPPGRIGSGPG